MNLVKSLSRIKDFRRGEGRRYPLIVILLITIMSIMSGRCRYREIARFADANKKELLKFFKLNRDRLPSHVTFREVIRGVNFEEVTAAFENWASQYVVIEPGECLAIDGKAIASTMTDYTKSYQNFVSMVSVFSHKRGQVVKTVKMESSKISEISVVQQLIEALDLKDVIFTLDALYCQKKTLAVIAKSGNNYIVQVKANQPKLLNSLKHIQQNFKPVSICRSQEKSRGRLEIR